VGTVRLRPVSLALVAGFAALLAALAVSGPARATIVERVVAVVGERPILWTELLRRAKSGRVQIRMQTHDPNVIGVQEQEMYKELLDRMVDDRMEEQQADRAHITVPADEIDRGISNIAAQAQQQQGRAVTAADILEEVARRGMTEQDFREEIRRQILEGKLIELRVRPRVHVTDQEGRTAYQHYVQEMTDHETMEVRILALRLRPTLSKAERAARLALAQEIVQKARAGEDFCKLVNQYSDDGSTRGSCGSRGPQPLESLVPQIRDIVRATKTGTYSDPTSIVMGQEEVVLILMPLGEARVPVYDDVKSEMMQRALMDGLEVARKQWLQELRRNVYVDIRL
jgi:peptidyl-prolyl cis-trans isomerase SurA